MGLYCSFLHVYFFLQGGVTMLLVDDYCSVSSFCQNYGNGCSFCIYSPNPRKNAKDKFVSCKCGSQSMLCKHQSDLEYCYDCDPYDPPCSLFSCNVSFND